MSVDKNKDSMETVELTKEAYMRLVEDQEFLSCLEAAGVDNWEGYGEAVRMFRESAAEEAED